MVSACVRRAKRIKRAKQRRAALERCASAKSRRKR
jgi:hypothetical protein